jgi:hypothetical protein
MPRPSSAPGPAQRRPLDRLGVHGLAEEIHDGHEGRCAPLGTPRAAVRWWCRSRLASGASEARDRSGIAAVTRMSPSSSTIINFEAARRPASTIYGQPLLMRIHQEASCHARAAPAGTSGCSRLLASSRRPGPRADGEDGGPLDSDKPPRIMPGHSGATDSRPHLIFCRWRAVGSNCEFPTGAHGGDSRHQARSGSSHCRPQHRRLALRLILGLRRGSSSQAPQDA